MASTAQLLQMVQKATRILVGSGNFDLLLKDVLAISVEAANASGGTIYIHDVEQKRLIFQHVLPPPVGERMKIKDMPDDFGMAGRAFQSRQTLVREFAEKPESEWNDFERAAGVQLRSVVAVPLMLEDELPIGVVQLINKREGTFSATDQAVLDIVAAVSTMGYLNARMNEESSRASTLLGMGKVSHDIGNLAASLHASLAFADMPIEGIKATLNGKARQHVEALEGTLDDLRLSVERIEGYSRLVSDLSAGRPLRPNMVVASMAETITDAAGYLEQESRTSHVSMHYDICKDAPPTEHDPLFVSRIVQNLVGNAIKAVREKQHGPLQEGEWLGSVCVRYSYVNGKHVLEVQDSGPGMTDLVARRILSGNARSQWEKASGSGWGMKIVLELAAAHEAIVAIDSQLGHGSTFRVVFPHRDVVRS